MLNITNVYIPNANVEITVFTSKLKIEIKKLSGNIEPTIINKKFNMETTN